MYFNGYFLQGQRINRSMYTEIDANGLFGYRDNFIEEEMQKCGNNVEYVLQRICDENYIKEKRVLRECEKSLNELEKREQDVDVKIQDWIAEHYRDEQLFYSENHPNNVLLYEYTNRILTFLGYEKTNRYRSRIYIYSLAH